MAPCRVAQTLYNFDNSGILVDPDVDDEDCASGSTPSVDLEFASGDA